MFGLALKREGRKVIILEQDPNSERFSHQAGIGVGESVSEFMRQYDLTRSQFTILSEANVFSWRGRWPEFAKMTDHRNMSSWGLLYRILRANFDGLVSPACEKPPAPLAGDGAAEYRTGQRVTDLNISGDGITVHYVDIVSGKQNAVDADLVIGADGVHSTVRQLVEAPVTKEYAGYVSWRGTVKESEMTPEALEFFNDCIPFQLMGRSYLIW